MSARDELEAAIWQRLRRYTTCARADDVDVILQAADRYAQAEYGPQAERRAELALAVGVAVHWQHPYRPAREAACSPAKTATTSLRAQVTCARCMGSSVWKVTA